ncbi:class I SAM-dependent RNA methyltransferase [Kytococcus sedentarius]|uniref:class I SAM-dependent RNA methyltransferase n=1 Tax=Kytococcus sedentarius TaxID=1276 RepID=UPI0035BC3AE3
MSRRQNRSSPRQSDLVGTRAVVELGEVAHGGHCVARMPDGRVVFVRHGLPGEQVELQVTEGGSDSRFLRADAVDVLRAAPGRREAPCPYSGPGGCGGCDFQHATPETQLELKQHVLTDQLRRLGGYSGPVEMRRLESAGPAGLRWRTRVEFTLGPEGVPGLRRHRSHEVIAVDDCLIATEGVVGAAGLGRPRDPGVRGVDVVDPSVGEPVAVELGQRGRVLGDEPVIREQTVSPQGEPLGVSLGARGFWQAHPAAVATYVQHVLNELEPRPGERVWDLFSGSGAFTVPLALAVGDTGQVLAVEGHEPAVDACAAALEEHAPGTVADLVVGDVAETLGRWEGGADLVVLDPPRTGAGRAVMEAVAGSGASRVAYVACDPAALGRDLGHAAELGLEVERVVGFDAFGTTHHLEAIATLRRR